MDRKQDYKTETKTHIKHKHDKTHGQDETRPDQTRSDHTTQDNYALNPKPWWREKEGRWD